MGRVRRLVLAGAAVAGVAGCGGDHRDAAVPARSARAVAPLVSVGQPTRPRFVAIGSDGGTLELAAPAVRGAPAFRLALRRTPAADPRDLCVVAVPVQMPFTEGDAACDVRSPGAAAVLVSRPGVPDRLGAAPTVVAGIAPPGIARVELDGPGGRRVLPLSRHRAFLALYAPGARGRVRVVAERAGGGRVVRGFSLPPSRDRDVLPRHRRRGAVFADEVGERILLSSYAAVVRRFGPPAERARHRGQRCLRYEVVGQPYAGWWLCFAPDGRMVSAGGP